MSRASDERWRRARIISLLLVGLASGCSTIKPQIFPPAAPLSDTGSIQSGEPMTCNGYDEGNVGNQAHVPTVGVTGSGPETGAMLGNANSTATRNTYRTRARTQRALCLDRSRAEVQRQSYIQAFTEQSSENGIVNLMLFGTVTAAVFPFLRYGFSDSTNTARAIYPATAAGALYGYSKLSHSQARQLLYIAGAEALTCVNEASAALQISASELKDIVIDSIVLRNAITFARENAAKLLKDPARCVVQSARPSDCTTPSSGDGKLLFNAAPPKGCVDRPATKICDASIAGALDALDARLVDAEALHAQVEERLDAIAALVPVVRAKTDNITDQIGREVLATESSPEGALKAAQSIRGIVADLTGVAQSGPKLPPKPPEVQKRYPEIEESLSIIRIAGAPVAEHERSLKKREVAFQDKIRACRGAESANPIVVEPFLESLTLMPNQAYEFLAGAGSATPSVNLLGDTNQAIEFKSQPNGAQVKVTLKLIKSNKSVIATLQFSAPGATAVSVPLVYFAKSK